MLHNVVEVTKQGLLEIKAEWIRFENRGISRVTIDSMIVLDPREVREIRSNTTINHTYKINFIKYPYPLPLLDEYRTVNTNLLIVETLEAKKNEK